MSASYVACAVLTILLVIITHLGWEMYVLPMFGMLDFCLPTGRELHRISFCFDPRLEVHRLESRL